MNDRNDKNDGNGAGMELDALKARYREVLDEIARLGAMQADGMLLPELRDRLRSLDSLEQEAGRLAARIRYLEQPAAPASGTGGAVCLKKRFTEQEVGRYVMTVAAACLCLLAFAVFIAGFWGRMPDGVKYMAAMAIGMGLWLAGERLSRKGRMPAFWLGIAGLGSGLVFLDIAAGAFAWNLYGMGMAGAITAAWAALNFYLGHTGQHGLFYVIGYAGGLTAILMANFMVNLMAHIMEPAPASGTAEMLMASGLAAAVSATGAFGWHKERKQYLLVLNMVFDMDAALLLAACSWGSGAHAQGWPALCLAGAALYLSRHVMDIPSWKRLRWAPRAVFSFFGGMCMAPASVMLGLPDMAGPLAAAAAIFLSGIGCGAGYAIGAAIPFYILLEGASEAFSVRWAYHGAVSGGELVCGALLPAMAAFVLCCIYRRIGRKEHRAAAALFYLMALSGVLGARHGIYDSMYMMSAAFLAMGLGAYLYQCLFHMALDKGPLWLDRTFEMLGAFVLPGTLLYVPARIGIAPDALPAAAALLGLQGYRIWSRLHPEGWSRAWAVWRIGYVVSYLCVMAGCIFASGADKYVITASMVLTAAFHCYRMAVSDGKAEPVLACLMANWHLTALSGMWGMESWIFIDVAAVVLSAGFIVAGFSLGSKGARKAGLACAVAFALKLGLLDAARGSSLGAAGGLLLAGAVCFAVSFLYNRLDRSRRDAG